MIHQSITAERVMAACEQRLSSLDNPGFCLACGDDAEGVESCGHMAVYGAEVVLFML